MTRTGQNEAVSDWSVEMMGWGMDLSAWLWMGIWILALLAMVWLVVRGSGGRPPGDDALAIIRSRFARGEITQEEFERARAALLADTHERQREMT